jgi:hypothetical protein
MIKDHLQLAEWELSVHGLAVPANQDFLAFIADLQCRHSVGILNIEAGHQHSNLLQFACLDLSNSFAPERVFTSTHYGLNRVDQAGGLPNYGNVRFCDCIIPDVWPFASFSMNKTVLLSRM